MGGIKFLSTKAFEYLSKIPAERWSRHAFSTKSKSAMVLNNCCESFNNVIKDAREKPILSMMEWIRRYILRRMMEKKEGMEHYRGKIMPTIVKQLELATHQSRGCIHFQVNDDEFEVEQGGYKHVVNLKERTCGCYKWDLTGIPCCHALRCIISKRKHPEDFVDRYYTKEVFMRAYAPVSHAMPGKHQWEKTLNPRPEPPPFRVMPGRPSMKKRRNELGEGQELPHHLFRKRQPNKCSRCGNFGHNKTKCVNDPIPADQGPPLKRGRKPKANKGVKGPGIKKLKSSAAAAADAIAASTQASTLAQKVAKGKKGKGKGKGKDGASTSTVTDKAAGGKRPTSSTAGLEKNQRKKQKERSLDDICSQTLPPRQPLRPAKVPTSCLPPIPTKKPHSTQ